jgi:glycerol-3-phosphate cytidylyltransferase
MSKSSTGRIVLLQGTFDLLNWGHVKAFQRAKAQGDYLIVALNTNALVKRFKGRDAVLPWYQKKFIIESCRFVDKVVRASDFSPLKLLKRYDVDVYVLTREWHSTKAREIAYMKKKGGRVVYSPRFKGVIPTSKIKEILLKEAINGGKV